MEHLYRTISSMRLRWDSGNIPRYERARYPLGRGRNKRVSFFAALNRDPAEKECHPNAVPRRFNQYRTATITSTRIQPTLQLYTSHFPPIRVAVFLFVEPAPPLPHHPLPPTRKVMNRYHTRPTEHCSTVYYQYCYACCCRYTAKKHKYTQSFKILCEVLKQ